MVADARAGFVDCRGKVLQRGYMCGVMPLILRACTCYEVVKNLHLGGHVFHLGVHYPDGFFVNGFGRCLNRGVSLVDGLNKISSVCAV